MKYLIRLADALSQLANTVIGGHPNESLSGRAYRTRSVWMFVIDTLFWFDVDHCKHAYLNDVRYAQWLFKSHYDRNQK
jgi:hypothetical protein